MDKNKMTVFPQSETKEFPYFWRIRKWFPERYGSYCRVLVRGKMNSALVEFEDGFKVVTSRNYIRRRDKKEKMNAKIPTPEKMDNTEEERITCPLCKINVLQDEFLSNMNMCIYCLNEKDGW